MLIFKTWLPQTDSTTTSTSLNSEHSKSS